MKNVFIFSVLFGFFFSGAAEANSGKEFTTSVIYGTLAGTLVGAATLAFTSNPGDNLNNVARGASYGLYAGILLGLYVTYGMDNNPPAEPEERPAPPKSEEPTIYEGNPVPTPPPPPPEQPQGRLNPSSNGVAFYPIIPVQGEAQWGGGMALNFHF